MMNRAIRPFTFYRLSFITRLGCCALNHHLAAIVHAAVNPMGAVHQVAFASGRIGCERRRVRDEVRAACAFATFGVPPFWIWHDLLSFEL